MLNSKLDVSSKLFFVSRRFLLFLIYFKQKKRDSDYTKLQWDQIENFLVL